MLLGYCGLWIPVSGLASDCGHNREMKRFFQQTLASPLGVWTGTGLVVAAVATVFFNGGAVLQAVHSPLVTREHKVWAKCVLRVWDASEQRNINTECGERPHRWIWEAGND